MTLEQLQRMNFHEILQKICALESRLENFLVGRRKRLAKRRAVEDAKAIAILQGKVIPLYYIDEFTGIHYRATGPANYILNNGGDDAA